MSRVVFGYEGPIYKDFPEQNRREIYEHRYIESIDKPSRAEVPLGYFVNGDMPEISTAIFSNTATFGKLRALSSDPGHLYFEDLRYNANGLYPIHRCVPKSEYRESLLDGLHVYHNPTARYPLDSKLLKHDDVTQHWYMLERGFPIDDARDGALLQRSVMKFNIGGSNELVDS